MSLAINNTLLLPRMNVTFALPENSHGVQLPSKPPLHPLSLSFHSPDLQKAFAEHHAQKSKKLVRFTLSLAVALVFVFAIMDQYLIPEAAAQVLRLRIGLNLCFATALGLTLLRALQKHLQLLMSGVILVGGLVIVEIIRVSEAYGGHNYYVGLILAIIYGNALLRLRFVYASITTWLVVFVYEIAALQFQSTPPNLVLNSTFFLVAANIMGMFSSYGLEYYMRAAFWQTHILREQSRALAVEHNRKTAELDKARQLQLAMLPKEIPQLPHLAIDAYMKTAMEVGGDYYDFQSDSAGALTVVIGDATGHGLNAGMMVTATKSIFETMADEPELTRLFTQMNRTLKRMNLRGHYMALQMLKIKDDALEICTAGMPPVLLYRAATQKLEEITIKAMPLGSVRDFPYRKLRTAIASGDAVLLMSDGLPELFNQQNEMFDMVRVQQAFAEVAQQSPREIIAHLLRAGEIWAEGKPQQDDMTFVVLKVK